MMSLKSAAVLIICDEILRHRKSDHISEYLIKELNRLQYDVSKITVVPEQESAINRELQSMVIYSDIIITVGGVKSGGVYKAIAGMISQKLQASDELMEILHDIREAHESNEVCIPIQAKVISNHVYPVIHLQRIFILKEEHLRKTFSKILKNHLMQYRKERSFKKTIRISQNGNSSTDLNEFNKIPNNGVKVKFSKDDRYFLFKVSSLQLSHVIEFERKITENFGSYCLNFIEDLDVGENVYASTERHVRNSIEEIKQCLTQYGPENIFLSFNGGKDCTVLLHLVLTVLKKKYPHHEKSLFCLYVQSESPFPEQDEFISQCQYYYNLEIMTIKSGIKDALQQTLLKNPNYKACLMGTRRTDPFSSDLSVFQMTDANWPQVMRISPLLDWHYSDIWDYLLYYKIPYCRLYDMGFTSLGNTENTKKNPSLVYYDNFEAKELYLPAYKLLKEVKERSGRDTS